jgi:predicted nucleic acid-binding protein
MILLDTNVVVAFLNGDKSVFDRIHGATLVTAHMRHFENIVGLKAEVWSIGQTNRNVRP